MIACVFRDYNLAIDQLSLFGSLVTGIPAETMAQATSSFSAWCLAVPPGAFLQTIACSPCASARDPQWLLLLILFLLLYAFDNAP